MTAPLRLPSGLPELELWASHLAFLAAAPTFERLGPRPVPDAQRLPQVPETRFSDFEQGCAVHALRTDKTRTDGTYEYVPCDE